MTPLDIFLALAYGFGSVIAFMAMGVDKWKAKRGRYRTPEATLLLWCACCGAAGGWLGMRVFRHKTRHAKFTVTVPVLMTVQIALLVLYIVYWR